MGKTNTPILLETEIFHFKNMQLQLFVLKASLVRRKIDTQQIKIYFGQILFLFSRKI